jgi:putative acetyltransferase
MGLGFERVAGEMLKIRPESDLDRRAIHNVHVSAFPTDAEAGLVDALRANGKATVSLVAETEGKVVGHVMFSPVSVESFSRCALGAGLAPLAVLPEYQRRGIGAKLVGSGIEICRAIEFGFVVVLGTPSYYRRFGFQRALSDGLENEYGVDDEFMVLELCRVHLPMSPAW